ncbi:type II secretion system F family protein [Nocardioides daeguensis]|uniref:VWFA domain-containing protein n=1 Tax=Nocardioides daeguensis TaxID=908359 RepID=A0ABP6UU18_9ACTN|nr:type II secretion system F family protein [Nocardioides daeguensis]MBV6725748.1 type II secretion system F family protein [Nocardioides daeguensis]MCR1772737.1 type II secretion system F family protein [Nocardioides daeguensis]
MRGQQLARGVAALLVALLALLVGAPALAADGGIAHVESSGDGIRILVDVPAGSQVDLSGVSATLDGKTLEATATSTSSGSAVKRTTVLVIDTSNSMRKQGRFEAAQQAASTYLDTVPGDVEVGIVTFDSTVDVALAPTTDRGAARTVIDGLSLQRNTLLYDGILAATDLAGDSGQRSLLLLSDGADAGSKASIEDAVAAIKDAGTRVHIVGLDLAEDQLAPLRALADAGKGDVITSSGTALAAAFAEQAEALADQVLVTAPLPSGFSADVATVEVSLPTAGGEPVVARSLATIEATSTPAAEAPLPAITEDTGFTAPDWLLWVGVAVFGVGLLSVAVLLVPAKPAPMSIADRVTAYSTRVAGVEERAQKPQADPVLDQAKAAAAEILERNSALNDRMTRRLTAAGSEFKPSEWLLLHVGTVLAAAVVGLLLGQGSIVLGLLFMAVGFVLPPAYLRIMAGRRRRAFDAALPDVLQLLSGALSAGLSLAQAVDTVVREGPEPIASEFKRVLVEARIGVSIEDAFEGVAHRFQSKDFGWAVMAIRIQRQVGGNLAELLTTVAATMRERQYLRRHVRALSAEGRLSAVILCGLPPVFGLYLFLTNREFLHPLVADPRGWVLLAFGVVWMTIGAFWMSRMVKVEA